MSKHAVSEEHSNPAELFYLKALVIICFIKLQTSISKDSKQQIKDPSHSLLCIPNLLLPLVALI